MKSVFNPNDNQDLVRRIQLLKPESQALWGKMNIGQMLGHLQAPIRVAVGDLNLKQTFIGFLFGKWALKKIDGDKPFDKNMPTAPEFKIKDQPDFATEQPKVIAMVSLYAAQGHGIITTEPHPFFGKMTIAQWDNLQWKHLDHHLRQFGV